MHIKAKAGPYRFLIPAASVLEVWTAGGPVAAQMEWRGMPRPYVDGGALLGIEGTKAVETLVAYGEGVDDPRLAILGLDEIAGAVPLTPAALRPFPAALTRAYLLFDGIAVLPEEPQGLLRLRAGLDLPALAGMSVPLNFPELSPT